MNDEDPEVVRVHGYTVDLERLTYATIVVMSVLAVYSGWAKLSFLAAILVVAAPVLALGVAHAFSEALHEHAENRRPLTAREWQAVVSHQLQLLLAVLPPLVLLIVGRTTSLGVENVRAAVLLTGMVTLIGLTAVAARHAGYVGWRWLIASLSGGVIGLVVIVLQVVLKPK